MKSKNKGITLIALVITIIVMLILVSVTISMAINGGLFENAGRAVRETENAKEQEQGLANGGIEIGGIWYESIDDYLTQHGWEKGTTFETRDTFTCDHCGASYKMGDWVDYAPEWEETNTKISSRMTVSPSVTTTITAEKSGLDRYYEANSSYPSNANVDGNGTQTIQRDDSVSWIVLGIEDTDKNGTNETLLITTADSVDGMYLYGAAAYNNGPEEINRICEELYSNSEYGKARGMTIEDVNRALNIDLEDFELGGMYITGTPESPICNTTGNLTTKLNNLPETIWNAIKENRTYTPDGVNTEEALGEYPLNGYIYGLNSEGKLLNPVNGNTIDITEVESRTVFYSNYALASRGVGARSDCAGFGPGVVRSNVAGSYSITFDSYGDERNFRAALRPVVSLTSKLPDNLGPYFSNN